MPKDPRNRRYFTVVFEGDLMKFPGNPLKTHTVFGPVVACGYGNAFEELDAAIEAADFDTIERSEKNQD